MTSFGAFDSPAPSLPGAPSRSLQSRAQSPAPPPAAAPHRAPPFSCRPQCVLLPGHQPSGSGPVAGHPPKALLSPAPSRGGGGGKKAPRPSGGRSGLGTCSSASPSPAPQPTHQTSGQLHSLQERPAAPPHRPPLTSAPAGRPGSPRDPPRSMPRPVPGALIEPGASNVGIGRSPGPSPLLLFAGRGEPPTHELHPRLTAACF